MLRWSVAGKALSLMAAAPPKPVRVYPVLHVTLATLLRKDRRGALSVSFFQATRNVRAARHKRGVPKGSSLGQQHAYKCKALPLVSVSTIFHKVMAAGKSGPSTDGSWQYRLRMGSWSFCPLQ